MVWLFVLLLMIVIWNVCGFQMTSLSTLKLRNFPLQMGRASVVRATTKSRTDSLKSKLYCHFGKKLVMAVKAGGNDPNINRRLAQVIEDAKASNVPKDIIIRNIERGTQTITPDYREMLFEYYGHGGVGILVNVLSDNENRVVKDFHIIAKKHDLRPATMNSVKFKFSRKARLNVKNYITEDLLMSLCLELCVEDYQLLTTVDGNLLSPSEHGHSSIYVDLDSMSALRDALRNRGFDVECSLVHIPLEGFLKLPHEHVMANMEAIHTFEALDDVDLVEHNMELTDGLNVV